MAVDKGDYLVTRDTRLGVRVRPKATNKHCVVRQELVGKLFQVPDSAGGQLGFLNEHEGRSVSEERDYVGQALAKPLRIRWGSILAVWSLRAGSSPGFAEVG